MMIFAMEKLEECWDECVVLAERHWKETQQYRHYQKFNPRYETYKQYEKMCMFFLFTARMGGKLEGYSGVYLTPSAHTQEMICTEDTWYISPEYRKGWTAIKFYRFIEKKMMEMGAVEATLTAPTHTKTGQILKFLGYNDCAVKYSKRLVPGRQPIREQLMESENVRSRAATTT